MAVSELPLKREEGDNTDESSATSKRDSGMTEKSSRWRDVREYFTSKEGWLGNYVCCSLLRPNLEVVHAETSLTMLSLGLSLSRHTKHMAHEQDLQGS